MNFQKWELFSGSPGIVKSCIKASFKRSVICTNDRNNSKGADLSIEDQMKGGENSPYPQCHHLLDTSGF